MALLAKFRVVGGKKTENRKWNWKWKGWKDKKFFPLFRRNSETDVNSPKQCTYTYILYTYVCIPRVETTREHL